MAAGCFVKITGNVALFRRGERLYERSSYENYGSAVRHPKEGSVYSLKQCCQMPIILTVEKTKAVALQRLLGIRDYFDYTYCHSCIMDTDVYQSGEKA